MRLFFLFLVSILSCVAAQAQKIRPNHQLLWKISGNGLDSVSYLYVGLESKDERVFEFNDSVYAALERCDAFAVSIESDSFGEHLYDKYFEEEAPNEVLQKLLTEDEYNRISKRLYYQTGHSLDETDLNNPDFLTSLFVNRAPIGAVDYSLDLFEYLHRVAKSRDKKIINLETLDELIKLHYYTDKEVAEIMASGIGPTALEQYYSDSSYYNQLLDYYLEGDLKGYKENSKSKGNASEKKLKTRNHNIAERLHKLLPKQSTFILLDIRSVIGDEGVIAILKSMGYTIEPILARFTGHAASYAYDPENIPWIEVKNENLGFQVEFPVRPTDNKASKKGVSSFYSFYDPSGPVHFYSVANIAPFSNLEEEQLLKQVLSRLTKDHDRFELFDKKTISTKVDGQKIEGFEALFTMEGSYYLRLQIYIREQRYLYLQVVEGDSYKVVYSSKAKRFFESLKFFEIPERELDWGTIEWEEAACRFDAIGEPEYEEILDDPQEKEGGKTLYYNFHNPNNGTTFILQCLVPGNGFFYQSYESLIKYWERSLKSEKQLEITSTKEFNDSTGKGIIYFLEDPVNETYFKVTYRGNRTYIIMISHQKGEFDGEDVQHFLESFEFTPFKETELTEYTALDKQFTVQFPSEEINTRPEESEEPYSYFVSDPHSGAMYEVFKEELNEYSHYPDVDSLHRYLESFLFSEEDTLLSKKEIEQYAPYKAWDYTIQQEDAICELRGRIIFANQTFYILKVHAAAEEVASEKVNKVLNSFKLQNASPRSIPKLDDRAAIIERIFTNIKEDVEQAEYLYSAEVYQALTDFEFTIDETHYIKAAMLDLSPKDTFSGQLLGAYLRALPDSLEFDSIQALLVDFYHADFIEQPRVQESILYYLSLQEDQRAGDLYKKYLLEERPEVGEDDYFNIMGAYANDRLEAAGFLFPEVLSLLDDPDYGPKLYSFLNMALDSALVDVTALAPYWQTLERQLDQNLKALNQFEKPESSDFRYTEKMQQWRKYPRQISRLISLFEHHPEKPKALKTIKKQLKNDKLPPHVRFACIRTLLTHSIRPNKKAVDELLEDYGNISTLYSIFNEKDAVHWFPKNLQHQWMMAKASILADLYQAEPEELEIVLIRKQEIEWQEESGWVYFFKIRHKEFDEDGVWYLACSDIYPDKTDLMPSFSFAEMVWKEMSEEEIEERIEKLIQKKQEKAEEED